MARIEVVVTGETRLMVFLDGELIGDTFDWHAQDSEGNLWYLGEDSTEYEDGEAISTDGSWETGVDTALPGIIMYADPAAHVNEAYRQEFYEGGAEDIGEIVGVGAAVTVRSTTYTDVMAVREWNPLEPGVVESKYHAPGIGWFWKRSWRANRAGSSCWRRLRADPTMMGHD